MVPREKEPEERGLVVEKGSIGGEMVASVKISDVNFF